MPLYDGTRRPLCPHALSYDRPGGRESKSGPQPDGGERIWRCLSLKELSNVEDIEIDAEDYPGDDPQNGQRGSC